MTTGRLAAILVLAIGILGVALWLVHSRDTEGPPAIAVTNAWAPPSPGKGETGAVYFEINNTGDSKDSLTAVETPVASKAEVHNTEMDGDVMRMRSMPSLEVFPGSHVSFAPRGMHLMLIGVNRPLADGDRFPVILIFDKSGRVDVDVTVHAPSALGDDSDAGRPGMKTDMKMETGGNRPDK